MTSINWTDKAYEQIVAKYPLLETKSVGIALCAWAYDNDPDCPVEKLRNWAKVDGITIGGRARSSARKIVGLKPKVSGAPKRRREKRRAIQTDRRRGVPKPRLMKGRSLFDKRIAQARGENTSSVKLRSALRKMIDGAMTESPLRAESTKMINLDTGPTSPASCSASH